MRHFLVSLYSSNVGCRISGATGGIVCPHAPQPCAHLSCSLCVCVFVCVYVCVLLQAPVAAVVLFGLGSVISVLYGVFTFRDCPEEAEALRKVVPC